MPVSHGSPFHAMQARSVTGALGPRGNSELHKEEDEEDPIPTIISKRSDSSSFPNLPVLEDDAGIGGPAGAGEPSPCEHSASINAYLCPHANATPSGQCSNCA